MKPIATVFAFFCLVSLSVSIQVGLLRHKNKTNHHRLHKSGGIDLDYSCKYETQNCNPGLKCTPIAGYVGMSTNIIVEWRCKKKDFTVAVNQLCIYQTHGMAHSVRETKPSTPPVEILVSFLVISK